MIFNSLEFLVFLPIYVALFAMTRGSLRMWISLIASYVFYGWWDWRFLGLITLLTGINFVTGLMIGNSVNQRQRKWALGISVVSSLGILGFFKYFNFFLANIEAIMGQSAQFSGLDIILPVGISFYTFQTMSYTIDLYRGEVRCERSLLKFATFVAFFPQLVAGPIVRAVDFLPQLDVDPPLDWQRVRNGFRVALWGFVMKCAVADTLASFVEPRFAAPENHTAISLLLGVVLYAFQIYCDFNGYSLIAIGLSRMLGYEFIPNFNRPYFSESFSEFWRRWHMSLSSWLRDYLYIPLGGNRHGAIRTYFNLMTTMVLGGLWHGAAWNFVIWGFLHGLYLVVQRLAGGGWTRLLKVLRIPAFVSRTLMVLFIFALTCLAWIFFRARDTTTAWAIISRIVEANNFSLASVGGSFYLLQNLLLVGLIVASELASFRWDFPALAQRRPALDIAFGVFCLLVIAFFGTFGSGAFIYFQF